MYRWTVRLQTRMPSLSSSPRRRSAPQRGLLVAISRISAARAVGGRPDGRERRRQNARQPAWCQRRMVAGWTSKVASRHAGARRAPSPIVKRGQGAHRTRPAIFCCATMSCCRSRAFSATRPGAAAHDVGSQPHHEPKDLDHAARRTAVSVRFVARTVAARLVRRLDYVRLCGLVAGSMTDPPALAFGNTLLGGDVASTTYAAVYPLTMILRVIRRRCSRSSPSAVGELFSCPRPARRSIYPPMPCRTPAGVLAAFPALAACSPQTTRQAPAVKASGFLSDYSRLRELFAAPDRRVGEKTLTGSSDAWGDVTDTFGVRADAATDRLKAEGGPTRADPPSTQPKR